MILPERAYRHYSFDLWRTLVVSHPEFKPRRTQYFFEQCNPLRKTADEVGAAFRAVDLEANAICEKTERNIDAEVLYSWVLLRLCDNRLDVFDTFDVSGLHAEMDALFRTYPAQLMHTDSPRRLAVLAETATLSILSNTGFIKGAVLKPILDQYEIGQLFRFQLYSDETGVSKPSPAFFEQMICQVRMLKPDIALNDIVHIGDNQYADVMGAQRAGIDAVWCP